MKKSCSNIYQLARKYAGMTQETAAELLNVSPRSLHDYESGKTTPPDDVACEMVEIYNTKWLAYEHLRNSSQVGKKYLPQIEYSDLAKTVLNFQKEDSDIDLIKRDMIEIACDGVIGQDERVRWSNVTQEIKEVAGAALAVLFAR